MAACAGGRTSLRRLAALALLAIALPTACADDAGGDPALVLAASSLTEAFTEVAALAEQHDLDVDLSFGGSQVLVEQVDQGAPADVVAVADPELLPDDSTAVVFARNRVVVIVPTGSSVSGVDDLARDGSDLRVVVAAESAPIGKYTRAGLADLGVLDAVMANVVSEEPDVKSVVAKVALGEADAGIVYATDARAERQVKVVGEPLPVETAYAAAVVPDAPHPAAGERFVALLVSQDAQRAFERFGFLPA
jgi:molybdate transport system substrate-binding protein